MKKKLTPGGCLLLSAPAPGLYTSICPLFSKIFPKTLANQSQVSYGASLGKGKECLYKWSRLHDQDGHYAHIWLKPSKIFYRTNCPMITKLGRLTSRDNASCKSILLKGRLVDCNKSGLSTLSVIIHQATHGNIRCAMP